MWWLFVLLEHDGDIYRYSYSRENRDLDGIIEFNTKSKKAKLTTPCAFDNERPKAQERTIGKFVYYVVEAGLPARKMVACG